jgi:serine/threonine protein kinase
MLASGGVSGPLADARKSGLPDERLPRDFGKYRLIKRIATGGMAEIFLAHTKEEPDLPVVVKRILPHLAESAEFVSMFLDEARIAARLTHPNIVEITDVGQVSGAYYIAMEYIHGEDVRRIYNQAYKLQRSLPLSHSIRVIAEAARGLEFAHTLEDSLTRRKVGVVHRDVSPQNILVTYGGGVKVVDFGIAKAANKVNQTRAGVLKGKYSYMSPEQALGDPIDHRTDIFALGIILYETTTGTRLFKRQNELATLQAVIKCEVVPPSDALPGYPVELEEIVLKALAKEPRDRHPSAEALAADLYRFLRSSRLYVEPAAIAEFMADLFADRLAEERASGVPVLPKEHEVRAEMEDGASIDDGTAEDGSYPSEQSEPSRNTHEASSAIVSAIVAHPSQPPPPAAAAGGPTEDTYLSPRGQATYADDHRPSGFGGDDDDAADDGTIPEADHEDRQAKARRAAGKGTADQVATVVNQQAYRDPAAPRVIAPEKPERSSGVIESTQYVRGVNKSVPPTPLAPEHVGPERLYDKPSERAPERTPDRAAERGTDRVERPERPSERVIVRATKPQRASPHTSMPPASLERVSRGSSSSIPAAEPPPRRLVVGLVVLFLLGVVVAVLAGLARSKHSAESEGASAGDTGELTIHTEAGAVVEVGERVLGSAGKDGTAGPYRLAAGAQVVRLTLGPGTVRERTVHVRAGGVHEIEVRARPGYVKLAVAPWARVRVDGREAGVTPLPPLTLSEGSHTLVLDNPDLRKKHVAAVVIEADQTIDLRVDLNAVGESY